MPLGFRVSVAVLVAVVTLCVLASRSVVEAAENSDPYKTVVIVTAPSPYWGYTYSPYGDFIRAQGDFLIKKEQAGLLREQVRREKLKTERLQLEHWEWKRDFLAGALNRERERVRQAEVERGRNFPPVTEILAAIPLNHLLDELQERSSLPADGSTAVEKEWLKHVHFTGTGQGNIGLLKGETIFWPPLLLCSEFTGEREKIDELLARAKKEVLVSPTYFQGHSRMLVELRQRVQACYKRLKALLQNPVPDPAWNPGHFIRAKRFLKQVEDAIAILEGPEADYYFSPLQGNTVAELVLYMKKSGIRFAPATVGCERYYIALHRALADEVNRLLEQQPMKDPRETAP